MSNKIPLTYSKCLSFKFSVLKFLSVLSNMQHTEHINLCINDILINGQVYFL